PPQHCDVITFGRGGRHGGAVPTAALAVPRPYRHNIVTSLSLVGADGTGVPSLQPPWPFRDPTATT
ncbi:MAG: hypothetical protein IJ724_12260, partial [Muribaculaceae bacterium]|nr:hypothetical protein [Muribaculaceae bacterium]